jgi:hypothetical protein
MMKQMKRRIYRQLNLTTFILALLVSPAWAATHWVNDNDPNGGFYVPRGTSCNNPGYQRIQAAVNAAAAGDVINVCPGTYEEQVVVATALKSNLTIRSVSPLQAIINAPAIMVEPGDLVTIDQSRNVTLRDFVISGPFPDLLFCSVELRSGVRVKGGGSALILGNHITEIRATNPALRGCQNGFAIAVGRLLQVPPQTGTAWIYRNVLDRYQKGGIYVDNVGSRADIRFNRVQGEGPVPEIAQNGIQISRGAFAQVRENAVVDHSYSLAPAASSSGLLLFGPPSVASGTTVEENILARNDDNIAVLGSSALRIEDNVAVASTFFDGIYMGADTSNNRITGNFLRNNEEHDCHDDSVGTNQPALVANVWSDNNGETENKPGLCTGRDDDDEDEDDDDHDDDGDRDDEDDDDDNDGKNDDEDSDDDNDGDHDDEDSDDDNDRIADRHDSESHKERQRSSVGELAPGEEHTYEISTDASSLVLIADAAAIAELLGVDNGLVVRIYNQAGLLVASSPPLAGPKIATTVPIPGNYTIKVSNQGAAPVSYKLARLVREAWLQ